MPREIVILRAKDMAQIREPSLIIEYDFQHFRSNFNSRARLWIPVLCPSGDSVVLGIYRATLLLDQRQHAPNARNSSSPKRSYGQ